MITQVPGVSYLPRSKTVKTVIPVSLIARKNISRYREAVLHYTSQLARAAQADFTVAKLFLMASWFWWNLNQGLVAEDA